MSTIDPVLAGSKNVCAFLDMLADSEIGSALLALSDDGYNVLEGSTPQTPILFPVNPDGTPDYRQHPVVTLNSIETSTAAGRYQIMQRYAKAYQAQLGLPDFGHLSQDLIAVRMMRECHAIAMLQNGNITGAIISCGSRWASLPNNSYGQHQNTLTNLIESYQKAGGTVA